MVVAKFERFSSSSFSFMLVGMVVKGQECHIIYYTIIVILSICTNIVKNCTYIITNNLDLT